MKIVGMMLARNEAWCIGLTARVALQWCDELVVLDHNSTDATRDIVADVERDNPGRMTLICENDVPHHQARFRQRALETARTRGLTHGAVIDADEFLTANLREDARALAARVNPGVIAYLPTISPHESLSHYRVDGAFRNELSSVIFADDPTIRYAAEADGYHFHSRFPSGTRPWTVKLATLGLTGGVWHLHSISRRRLEVKAACYKALERVEFPERNSVEKLEHMYGWTLKTLVESQITPDVWWEPFQGLVNAHLDLHAEPWQLAELRRVVRAHPRSLFAGLDFYGAA